MVYINSTPDDPKGMREALKNMGDQLIKISTAHHELDMTLAQFELNQNQIDDPEMMASAVADALKKFFTNAGYHSTVSYLDRIKTYY